MASLRRMPRASSRPSYDAKVTCLCRAEYPVRVHDIHEHARNCHGGAVIATGSGLHNVCVHAREVNQRWVVEWATGKSLWL